MITQPYISDHGGHCCGMTHIHGFPWIGQRILSRGVYVTMTMDMVEERVRSLISKYMEDKPTPLDEDDEEDSDTPKNHLFECVLNDDQMKEYAPMMKRLKFRLVTRFVNTNHNNACNVLHYTTCRLPEDRRAKPFEW